MLKAELVSEMKLIIVLYIATSIIVGKPVEDKSNTKGKCKIMILYVQ